MRFPDLTLIWLERNGPACHIVCGIFGVCHFPLLHIFLRLFFCPSAFLKDGQSMLTEEHDQIGYCVLGTCHCAVAGAIKIKYSNALLTSARILFNG